MRVLETQEPGHDKDYLNWCVCMNKASCFVLVWMLGRVSFAEHTALEHERNGEERAYM